MPRWSAAVRDYLCSARKPSNAISYNLALSLIDKV